MTRRKRLVYTIAIIAALIFISLISLNKYFAYKYSGYRSGNYPPPKVSTTIVQAEEYNQQIEAPGTTLASESVVITANVDEHVEKIFFDDGHHVKKGDKLVELDSEAEIAQLDQAKARLIDAENQFNRTLELSKKKYTSKAEFDTKEANLKTAKAELSEIEAQIRDRVIIAPFDGILGFRKISQGALVQKGTEIVTLDAIDPIKVDFNLSEKYLKSIKPQQKIIATSVAYPNQKFIGYIKAIDSRINSQSRSIMVRGIIENKKHELKPGMHMQIHINLPNQNSIMIPEEALTPISGKQTVFVIQSNNTVKRKTVEINGRKNGKAVISSGLKEGDKIVVDGGFKLQDGQKVEPNVAI